MADPISGAPASLNFSPSPAITISRREHSDRAVPPLEFDTSEAFLQELSDEDWSHILKNKKTTTPRISEAVDTPFMEEILPRNSNFTPTLTSQSPVAIFAFAPDTIVRRSIETVIEAIKEIEKLTSDDSGDEFDFDFNDLLLEPKSASETTTSPLPKKLEVIWSSFPSAALIDRLSDLLKALPEVSSVSLHFSNVEPPLSLEISQEQQNALNNLLIELTEHSPHLKNLSLCGVLPSVSTAAEQQQNVIPVNYPWVTSLQKLLSTCSQLDTLDISHNRLNEGSFLAVIRGLCQRFTTPGLDAPKLKFSFAEDEFPGDIALLVLAEAYKKLHAINLDTKQKQPTWLEFTGDTLRSESKADTLLEIEKIRVTDLTSGLPMRGLV